MQIRRTTSKGHTVSLQGLNADKRVHTRRRTAAALRNSTTNFLTATTLIYAIGAGITAAAGHLLSIVLPVHKHVFPHAVIDPRGP